MLKLRIKGLKLLDPSCIKNIIVIRDPSLVIKLMNNVTTLTDGKLARHILRIQKESYCYGNVSISMI